MQKKIVTQSEIKLIGLKVRTSYNNESNPATSKIGPLVQRYWAENIAEKTPHRKNPGVKITGYSNYASDEYGEYDFFYGEEVSSLDDVPPALSSFSILTGKYLKITSEVGKIPDIIIKTWQQVWTLTSNKQLVGQRQYQTDFEIYDQRANDPEHAIFDIYLGIK